MLLPALAAAKRKAQRISCVNNQKEVGLAFKIWEGDNSDRYPMAVPSSQGGAQEQMAQAGNAPGAAYKTQGITNCFAVMSNELSTPKILACPSDSLYTPATTFWQIINPPGPATGTNAITHISYFVGGDAADAYPQMILDGDRNIGGTTTAGVGVTTNSFGSYSFWNGTSPNTYYAWTINDLHLKAGNLGLADGSVSQVSVSGLQQAMIAGTNQASVSNPAFNWPQ